MNEIGQGEGIDPTWGVYNWRVRDYLNNWLSANVPSYNWDYVESKDSSKADLKSFIVWDIDANRGLETALLTKNDAGEALSGWPSNKIIRHITAIRGYVEGANYTQVHYIETGQSAQGYSGSFYQNLRITKFYNFVNADGGSNNSQVW
jgi:hypothetical protein